MEHLTQIYQALKTTRLGVDQRGHQRRFQGLLRLRTARDAHRQRPRQDLVALTIYALVKGHAAECTETRQVFARNRLGIKDSVISRDQRAMRVRKERFAGDRYLRHEEPPRPQLDRGLRSPQIDSLSIMTSL